jgi:hypothetical protein
MEKTGLERPFRRGLSVPKTSDLQGAHCPRLARDLGPASVASVMNSGVNSAGEDHIDLEPILDVLDHDAGDLYGIANILLGATPVIRPGENLGGLVDVNA